MEMPRSNTGVDLMNCSSDNSLYLEGEKVWASYGGKWYQAKVQKVESRMNAWTYFVHYLGWNKRWDEWLGTQNLMKFSEEDVENQLMKGENTTKVKKTKSNKKNKEKQSTEILLEENMNIEIPRTLKKQLVDDFEFVTHLGKKFTYLTNIVYGADRFDLSGEALQLVKLPRSPNVGDILKKYFVFRVKKNNKLSQEIQEILTGLHGYFNKALPSILLYKNERAQYEALIECAPHISPSVVYGAEHLLRLLVKLPKILNSVKIQEETQMKIHREIHGLLKFLEKNQSTFVLSTYQTPEDLDDETEDLDDVKE